MSLFLFLSRGKLRNLAGSLVLLTIALFVTQVFPAREAQAQAVAAPAVNKYLIAGGLPSTVPNLSTTFANVTTASVNVQYTYVITVNSGTALSADVAITDALPPGFVATGCAAYVGDLTVSVGTNGPLVQAPAIGSCDPTNDIYGPFTSTTNPGKVISYITGTFTTTGPKVNTATATTKNNGVTSPPSTPASVAVTIVPTPPVQDLGVVKTATPNSIPNGGTVNYKIVITNNSSIDVPISTFVSVLDKISNNTTTDVEATWSAFTCTPTTNASGCFGAPAWPTVPYALDANTSVDLFSANGLTATGVLKVGESITITYDVLYETFDQCANTPPTIQNSAYLRNGNGSGNFPDSNLSNNTSNAPITITGLPTVCPPSPITVSKTAPNPPAPAWGQTIPYVVTVTNTAPSPMEFRFNDHVSTPAPAVTTFSASIGAWSCTSTCANTVVLPNPQTFIGSAPRKLFENVFPQAKVLVPSGATVTISYDATYKASCSVGGQPTPIVNTFKMKGKILSSPAVNTTVVSNVTVVMPPLPKCQLKVLKQWSPGVNPNSPLPGFGPTIGTYKVRWINTAPYAVQMGTVWDVMHIDSNTYPTVPVTHSAPVCMWTTGSGSWTYNPGPLVVPVSYAAAPGWQGAQIITGSNATFGPLSTLMCTYSVSFGAPSPSDPLCQSTGAPYLINAAMADIDPAYNPSTTPFTPQTPLQLLQASAKKRLPLCRNVTVQKTANPTQVLPGGSITWTITVINNGPSGPIGGFKVKDVLPPGVGVPTGFLCTPGKVAPCSAAFFGAGLTVSNLGAGQSATIKFTTTAPLTIPWTGTNVASAVGPTPGYYYKDPSTLTAPAQATLAWPLATKAFNPSSVGPGQVSLLTFVIYNLSYQPAVSPMAFTDQLPPGLNYGPIQFNDCASSPNTVLNNNPTNPSLQLTQAALAANTPSCKIVIEVRGTACATYNNVHTDVTGAVKVGTDALDATLNIPAAGCTGNTGNGNGALPRATKSFSPANVFPGSPTTLTFTITGQGGTNAGINFTDTLPLGVTYSGPATNSCGGTATLTGNVLVVSGAVIATPTGSCTITLQGVTSTCATYTNGASNVSGASGVDTSGLNSAFTVASAVGAQQCAVAALPKLTKAFNPTFTPLSTVSTLTFTITNTSGNPAQSGMSFVDNFPAGLLVGSVVSGSIVSTCGGTAVVTTAGTSATLTVSGAVLASGQSSCTITMQAAGLSACTQYKNLSGNVSGLTNLDASGVNATLSTGGFTPTCVTTTTTSTTSSTTSATSTTSTTIPNGSGSSGCKDPATQQPFVCPKATKSFSAPVLGPAGYISTLTFTLTNTPTPGTWGALGFTDVLPVLASGTYSNVVNNCGGTANLGTAPSKLIVSGAQLNPSATSCTITIQVVVKACGNLVNQANDVTGASYNLDTSGLTATLALPAPGAAPLCPF